jgi:hypothetical protein
LKIEDYRHLFLPMIKKKIFFHKLSISQICIISIPPAGSLQFFPLLPTPALPAQSAVCRYVPLS